LLSIYDCNQDVSSLSSMRILLLTNILQPDIFPNPQSVDPRRPVANYTLMGDGLHRCFTDEFVHSVSVSFLC
jgi:hypothetical protein